MLDQFPDVEDDMLTVAVGRDLAYRRLADLSSKGVEATENRKNTKTQERRISTTGV